MPERLKGGLSGVNKQAHAFGRKLIRRGEAESVGNGCIIRTGKKRESYEIVSRNSNQDTEETLDPEGSRVIIVIPDRPGVYT